MDDLFKCDCGSTVALFIIEDHCQCAACMWAELERLQGIVDKHDLAMKVAIAEFSASLEKRYKTPLDEPQILPDWLQRAREHRAIVDKLPKGGDGTPVLLGDNRYAIEPGLGIVRCGFVVLSAETDPDGEWWGTVRSIDGGEWGCRAQDTYLTKAAAEAAKAKEGE